MRKAIIAWTCVLVWMGTACNNTRQGTAEQSTTDSAATGSSLKPDSLPPPQELGWSEVQPYDLPIIRSQMEEVDSNEITVRGNERFTAYELSDDILFDAGKATLKPTAETRLKQVSASIKKRYSNSQVRIFGYTDAVESKTSDTELAEKRAETVKDWLVKNGNVEAARISIHPRGESNPVASNATPAGRKENRRVEIVVRNQ
jgi:outer membrane protein OmpA-like peptidoglycan-associated protein